MNVLVTNDDGIGAPGLAAMYGIAVRLGQVRVLAPAEPQSCRGHGITTRAEIEVERLAGRPGEWYRTSGTPADCVRLAVAGLLGDAPDIVLAGINEGANVGMDVFHSGTVAAAREAAAHGKLGIAVSQYTERDVRVDWERAAEWAGEAIRDVLDRSQGDGGGRYWNVNLPLCRWPGHHPQRVVIGHDVLPLPLAFEEVALASGQGGARMFVNRARYQERARSASGDVAALFAGAITLTPLTLQTHHLRPPP